MEATNTNYRKALDLFLVDNPELERLSTKLSEFNIFHILRSDRAELKHSNVLAWLLNPKENHGLEDKF